jgi:hypothetical protein
LKTINIKTLTPLNGFSLNFPSSQNLFRLPCVEQWFCPMLMCNIVACKFQPTIDLSKGDGIDEFCNKYFNMALIFLIYLKSLQAYMNIEGCNL